MFRLFTTQKICPISNKAAKERAIFWQTLNKIQKLSNELKLSMSGELSPYPGYCELKIILIAQISNK